MEYPLSSCTFSKAQSEKIHRTATKAIIGALGVNRMFPRVIAFSPTELMGIGLHHPYTSQGIQHILMLIAHTREKESENGKMYRMILEMAQLLFGTSESILQSPEQPHKYVSDPYLDFMMTFLSEHDLSIAIPELWKPTKQREKDQFIMEAVRGTIKSPKQQRQMNQCRLYLQVLRLSDLCNGSGDELMPAATTPAYRMRTHNTTKLEWPRQDLPPAESWRTWTKVLRQLFLVDKIGQLRSYRLTIPLGYWLTTEDTIWQHVYSPTTNQIYERRREDFYYSYCRTTRWTSNFFSDDDETADVKTNIPIDSYPATQDERTSRGQKYSIYRPQSIFEFQRNIHRTTSTRPRFVLTRRTGIPTESQTDFEQPLLRHVTRIVSAVQLRSALALIPTRTIRIGIAIASLGEDLCYGWSLHLGTQQLWTGKGTMPQGIGSATPRMCHAAAMYASCFVARTMSNSDWKKSTPCIQIITKNDESKKYLSSVFGRKHWYSPRSKLSPFFPWSENLLNLMSERRAWIYAYDQLTEDANDNMRDAAYIAACGVLNEHMQHTEALDTPELATSSLGRAYILHKKRIITRDYASHIRQAVHTPHHQKYICEKENWTDDTYNTINWQAAGTAFAKRPLNSRIRLTKYMHNWLPLGETMKRIDPNSPTTCPSCKTVEETTDHIMRCGSETRHTKRQEQLIDLREKLDEIGTPDNLKEVMYTGIQGWISNSDYQHPTARYSTGNKRLLQIAIRNQNHIGWGQVFRGRLATEFQMYASQQKYGRPTNKYVSQEWSIRLIQWLWDQVESQWTLRNESLHGIDIEDTRSKVRGRITDEVRRLYAYKEQLLPQDQRITLPQPIETVLTWNTAQMQIWTETVRPTINRCLQEYGDDQSTDRSTSTTPSV